MIETKLSQAVVAAVKSLYGLEVEESAVQLQKTRSEFEGDITLLTFPFVKAARKAPEQVSAEIGEYLVKFSFSFKKNLRKAIFVGHVRRNNVGKEKKE